MTIRTKPNTYIPTSAEGSHTICLWYWLKWMQLASPDGPGWTMTLSCDGNGNYGSGDKFSASRDTGAAQLNRYVASTDRAWFVLQAPDGREILVYKESATDSQFRIYYAPAGGYTGGDAWNPPTTAGLTLFMTNAVPSHLSWTGVLHMAADDAAPYGFWFYAHESGQTGYEEFCFAQLPLDVVAAPGDTDPFVTWYENAYQTSGGVRVEEISYESLSYNAIARSTKPDGTGGNTIAALHLRNNQSTYFFPENVDLLPSGEDVSMPIPWGRNASSGSGFFKGISSWFQWNGYARAVGEMFNDRSRVSIGDVNVPWDGSSDWLSS